ncbi:MAG: VWA domain-containing protein [Chloroflexota bacterium]
MNTENNYFEVVTDREALLQDSPSSRVLKMTIKAPATAQKVDRPRMNLSLVLDRSGSMSGEKLAYVKKAASYVVDMLQEQDFISVVTFDDKVDVLSQSASAAAHTKTETQARLAKVRSGGSTNLSGGWFEGCKEIANTAVAGTINRSLLLTDGLANVGIENLEELAQHAGELSRRGISTSTFGVGTGFNEHLLEAMSNNGGGNFYYIADPADIPSIFQREFSELTAITLRDVEINLKFPPAWFLKVPGSWTKKFTEGHLKLSVGSLFSGQTLEIYIRINIPVGGNFSQTPVDITCAGTNEQNNPFDDHQQVLFINSDALTFQSTVQRRDVMEGFAIVYLADMVTEILKMERGGFGEQASLQLRNALNELSQFIHPAEFARYSNMADRMRRGMDEMDRKTSHYNAYNEKRQRSH